MLYFEQFHFTPDFRIFDGRTPNTVIGDPAILRKILIKDFENFPTRRYFDNNNKYMGSMLSNMKGQTWKDTRCALSPAFTSGKIKLVHSVHLITYLMGPEKDYCKKC